MLLKSLLLVTIVSISSGAFAYTMRDLDRVECGDTTIILRKERVWVNKTAYKMKNIVIDDRFHAIHFNVEGSDVRETVYYLESKNELHYKVDNHLNIDVKCINGLWK